MKNTYCIEWRGRITRDVGWDYIEADSIEQARENWHWLHGSDRELRGISTRDPSRIERFGIAPSTHGRSCAICGEKFGPQCFGGVIAADLSNTLDDLYRLPARELCNRCGDRHASAHFVQGSLARMDRSFRAWWKAFGWYWPRRHAFDLLKHPRNEQ